MQYLTSEWAAALTAALNHDEEFRQATAKREAVLQFRVKEMPDGGETTYNLVINLGTGAIVLGDPPRRPTVTFTSTYEVSSAIASGRLDGREAVQSGRMEASAEMVTLIRFASTFQALNQAQGTLAVDY